MKVTFDEVDATCKTNGCGNRDITIRCLVQPPGYVLCGLCNKKINGTVFVRKVEVEVI